MATIFKELEKAREEIKADTSRYDDFRKDALAELTHLIYSECWWGEKGKVFAEQYLCYSDLQISVRLGIKLSSVRSNRRTASKKLGSIVGDDIIQIILDGSQAQVERKRWLFRLLEHPLKMRQELHPCIYQQFYGQSISVLGYDLSECMEELKFLQKHSTSMIQKQIEKLNADKLAYLVNADQWDEFLREDKAVLYAFLHYNDFKMKGDN